MLFVPIAISILCDISRPFLALSILKLGEKIMAQCPDCQSVIVELGPPRGNGNCDLCYGTGEEQGLGRALSNATSFGEPNPCYKCHGTGQCQTCGGTGE